MPSVSYPRHRKRPYGAISVAGSKTTTTTNYVGGLPVGTPSVLVQGSGPFPRGFQDCNDYVTAVGPYADHDLTLYEKVLVKQGLVNGIEYNPEQIPTLGARQKLVYQNWSTSVLCDPTKLSLAELPSINWPVYRNLALGRFNPNKPESDLPLFIFELRDFPAMLKHAGDLLHKFRNIEEYLDSLGSSSTSKDVAEGYLSFQFGWKPFISDLLTMHNGMLAFRRTIRLMTDAKQGKTVRSTLSTTFKRIEGVETLTLATIGSKKLIVELQRFYEERIWSQAATRPKTSNPLYDPSSPLLSRLLNSRPPSDSNIWTRDLASVYGLSGLSAATLWKAYPWTWLIDYAASVSSFLEASRGYIPFEVFGMNTMAYQKRSEISTVVSNTTKLTYRPHLIVRQGKSRDYTSYPVPTINFNVNLNVRRWNNLGALLLAGSFTKLARTE